MQLVVGQLVRQAESVPTAPVLEHEGIHVDPLQVAREEGIHFEVVADAVDRHDLQLEIELDDLFDGHRQRPLGMELVEEFLGPAPDIIVREDRRAEGHVTSCGWRR